MKTCKFDPKYTAPPPPPHLPFHLPPSLSNGYLFSTVRDPSVNRKDLRDLTLVRPTRDNPGTRPLSCTTPRQPTTSIYFLFVQILTQVFVLATLKCKNWKKIVSKQVCH